MNYLVEFFRCGYGSGWLTHHQVGASAQNTEEAEGTTVAHADG